MEKYPQYRFEHFFRFSYIEGGLTIQQVQALYETHCKRVYEERKFLAAINGVDVSGEGEKEGTKSSVNYDKIEKKQGMPLFRDPSEYEDMSQEEKDKLTNNMMSQHKQWVGNLSKTVGK